MNAQLLEQARQLSIQDQLELVEALWDDISKRNAIPLPTDAQKAELDRRLSDYEANQNELVAWGDVKSSAFARIGR